MAPRPLVLPSASRASFIGQRATSGRKVGVRGTARGPVAVENPTLNNVLGYRATSPVTVMSERDADLGTM